MVQKLQLLKFSYHTRYNNVVALIQIGLCHPPAAYDGSSSEDKCKGQRPISQNNYELRTHILQKLCFSDMHRKDHIRAQ